MNGLSLIVYNLMTIISERKKRKIEETMKEAPLEKDAQEEGGI